MIKAKLTPKILASLFIALVKGIRPPTFFFVVKDNVPFFLISYKTIDIAIFFEYEITSNIPDLAYDIVSPFKYLKAIREHKLKTLNVEFEITKEFLITKFIDINLVLKDNIKENSLAYINFDSIKSIVESKPFTKIYSIPVANIASSLFFLDLSHKNYEGLMKENLLIYQKGNMKFKFTLPSEIESPFSFNLEVLYLLAKYFYLSVDGWKLRYDHNRFKIRGFKIKDYYFDVFENETYFMVNPSFCRNVKFYSLKPSNIISFENEDFKYKSVFRDPTEFVNFLKFSLRTFSTRKNDLISLKFFDKYIYMAVDLESYTMERYIENAYSTFKESITVNIPMFILSYIAHLKNMSFLEIGISEKDNFLVKGRIELAKEVYSDFENLILL